MAISFDSIPNGNLVPFLYVEFNNSAATQTSAFVPFAGLLIGQKVTSGTAAAGVLIDVIDAAQAVTFFGDGSQLAQQCEAWFASNPGKELTCIALEDAAGSAASVGTMTITGTATAAGSVIAYFGGRRFVVGVDKDDDPTAIADAISASVTAKTDLCVTAANVAGVVTITAKNKGLAGNGIDLRINQFAGEELAPGVTVAFTPMANGAGDPDLSTVGIAGIMNDEWYQVISHPYTEKANIDYVETELTNRWGPIRQIGGIQYIGAFGTFTQVGAKADDQNSPFTVIITNVDVPTTAWEQAAETAAIVAGSASINPARPFQTLTYNHTMAPRKGDDASFDERNILLNKGCMTFKIGGGRTMQVERILTTYKTGATGAPDSSYRNANTVYTLQAIRYDWRTYIANKYPRHLLASDGANYGEGLPVMTPKTMRGECVNRFKAWEKLGWTEGLDQFKETLIVERNAGDTDRIDVLMQPNLMNQFRIAGVQVQFIL